MVLKYECEDNINLVSTWSGDGYVAATGPDFKYVVNANSGAASTAIKRKLSTVGDLTACNAGMLTTIEMLQNGGDWVPLYIDGVQQVGAAPSWVT